MCDVRCPSCAEDQEWVALAVPPEGCAMVILCRDCRKPAVVMRVEGHAILRPLDPEEYQALLLNPVYQRTIFALARHEN